MSDFRNPDYEFRLGASFNGGLVVLRTPVRKCRVAVDGTYWVAAHYTTPDGSDIYSPNPTQIVVSGAVLKENVVKSYDESATGWSGACSGNASVSGGNVIVSAGGQGVYTIPSGHRVNVGYAANAQVIFQITAGALPSSGNFLGLTNFLSTADFLGVNLGPNAVAQPQIRVADGTGTYGAWQNYEPGLYTGQYFDGRVVLTAQNGTVIPEMTGFVFTVAVPDRTDDYTNQAIAAGGTAITYASPFNAGPNGATIPNVQVTVINSVSGDTVALTGQSLSGCTIQVLNGGVGVARNVHAVMKGY